MNLGVIIRSIGERTEALCAEAVAKELCRRRIHILRGYHPSHVAFLRMFEIAREREYDWFLGLDADVVLKPGWSRLVLRAIEQGQEKPVFRIHYKVDDQLLNSRLIRGNNLYTSRFIDLDIRYLKKNIRISSRWLLRMLYSNEYYLTAESSIRAHMLRRHGLGTIVWNKSI